MVRVCISVEGLTEERFVQKLLVPHYSNLGIFISPTSIGGNISIPRITAELERLAYNYDFVTTLYDFYGFKGKSSDDTKATLEQAIKASIKPELSDKVIPNVQMYEFEALLFSSPPAIGNVLGGNEHKNWAQGVLDEFHGDPETINDSTATAPSKRLLANTHYKKTMDGPDIACEIGLEVLRERCAGFNAWIASIEALA